MKKAVFFFTVVASLCFFSCSSPENDGKSIANKLNKCNESYLEEMQKMESNFIAGFNGAGFPTRKAAKQAYLDVAEEVYSKYRDALAKVYDQEAEMSKQYASDYKKKSKYDNALSSNIDRGLESKVVALTMATEIPESVMAKIRTIIPPKPDYLQIQEELVGHSLTEGVEDGYYSSGWRWNIEDGEISDFVIISVLSDTPNEYVIIATMKLTSMVGKAFNTKVKIRYILPACDDWNIEYITSLGMNVVKTGIYDNLIELEQGNCNDGFFVYTRRYCYFIENKGDIPLEIGYKKYNGTWSKESTVIKAYDTYQIECDDFIIDYIERP